MDGKFNNLARTMVTAIQGRVAQTEGFKEGAIRLLFVGKCPEADEFLGGFGPDCEVDLIFPAKPGFSHTRPAINGEPECDCSGRAAAKIQASAFALKHDFGNLSRDVLKSDQADGRLCEPGGVAIEVLQNDTEDVFMRIYIGVDGAIFPGDNERCAVVGQGAFVDWAKDCAVKE